MSEHFLHTNIEFLSGIGKQKSKLLKEELNITTYHDLLNFFPFRYVDKSKFHKIKEIDFNANIEVQVSGKFQNIQEIKSGKSKRLVADLVDITGTIQLVWFKYGKWLYDSLLEKNGKEVLAFGKPSKFNHSINMVHPELDLLQNVKTNFKPYMPIYSSTETLQKKNVNNRFFQKIMGNLLQEIKMLKENLPKSIINQNQLIGRLTAYQQIHFPSNAKQLIAAQYRLKFSEFFYQQLGFFLQQKQHKIQYKSYPFKKVGRFFNQYYQNFLNFELTTAQKRVIKEIRQDLKQDTQMNRLLQGDVGSGKTVVAFLCMLIAIDNKFQAAMLAPTEILAQQHFASIHAQAKQLGLQVELLTGSTTPKERELIFTDLQNGTLHILVGTHAILEEKVIFKNLGFTVVDEQHKFGVAQRAKLYKKNKLAPHMLVMTATPIPRTLAMTMYGDLSLSVIDELPKGRKQIKTYHQTDANRLAVLQLMRREIAKGRQVYVVYPLIEESKNMNYKDLMDGYESISRDFPLPKYAVSVVHGKMKPADKEFEMNRFAAGKTQILVSTTVIEVGVNVPNASVMVIESAEKFGLSQLHQLRGRVGRGAEQSFCVLLTDEKLNPKAKKRIQTMCQTNDGFLLAEVDLELRGPGDLMGTQQSGIVNYKIADLVKDQHILNKARQAAKQLIAEDSDLILPENQPTKKHFNLYHKHKIAWSRIG